MSLIYTTVSVYSALGLTAGTAIGRPWYGIFSGMIQSIIPIAMGILFGSIGYYAAVVIQGTIFISKICAFVDEHPQLGLQIY